MFAVYFGASVSRSVAKFHQLTKHTFSPRPPTSHPFFRLATFPPERCGTETAERRVFGGQGKELRFQPKESKEREVGDGDDSRDQSMF